MTSIEHLEHRLTQWSNPHDAHVNAAVQLLINHNFWLGRTDFVDAAVRTAGSDTYISWTDARTGFDAGDFQPASSTELAVLDLAIALGEDRYRLSRMGDANATAIAAAVTEAVGA